MNVMISVIAALSLFWGLVAFGIGFLPVEEEP